MDDESTERQLNIHLDPDHLAGVYANFANVSFSDYEFTLTFARVDHEVDEGEVPGVVVPDTILQRMQRASESGKEAAMEEGLAIAREMVETLEPRVQGVQVSAPFGKVGFALQVFEALSDWTGPQATPP